jgi:hypothetical protein
MPKYRKKQVEVEAFRFGFDEPPLWFTEAEAQGKIELQPHTAVIETLEGKMRADHGDWVIQGVEGEIYPCKPNIFKMTYENVEA